MQITVAAGYLPPSDKMIRTAASEIGLNINLPSFVRDVCTLRAGGRLKNFEELEETIEQELKARPITLVSAASKEPKFKRVDLVNRNYNSRTEARNAFFADHRKLAADISNALDIIPKTGKDLGATPMHQALSLIKLLQHASGQKETTTTEENNILKSLLSPDNLAKAKAALESAKETSQQERNLLKTIASLKDKQEQQKDNSASPNPPNTPGGQAKAQPENAQDGNGSAIMQAAIQLTDSHLRDALKVSRKLQSFSKLKTSKISKFVPDTQESEVQNRSMKSFSEIGKIKSNQYATMRIAPNLFRYKAATNQFMVRERGNFAEKQQLLYLVVDSSGSMLEDEGRRIALAAGVLINRLMAVAKGDAKVYWRFFDNSCYDVKFVEDKDTAYQTISEILNTSNFSGGGTNFDMAIQTAVSHIESLQDTLALGKPELFMVTDGACHCASTIKDLKGVKLHTAYVSDDHCEELTQLSRQSGGVVVDLST